MQQINIKSDEAYRLANELSRLTGENMTQAITRAIEERLEKLRAQARNSRGRGSLTGFLLSAAEARSFLYWTRERPTISSTMKLVFQKT